MNKAQIKAELRRAAAQMWPPADCDFEAYEYAMQMRSIYDDEFLFNLDETDCQTFFLLVAEAL